MQRVGFGIDSHRLEKGVPLVLGGVNVPFEKGLISHSDGDVVIHSIIDAILGAAGLGDIGEHFPDMDPQYKGISSKTLLEETFKKIANDWEIINVDVTIIAEQPKLKIYKKQMEKTVSEILTLEINRINIKASTTEGMGFEGRSEGITTHTVCLLESITKQ